jgi:aminoglycoside phosphotransferase (APT) family kinase protein
LREKPCTEYAYRVVPRFVDGIRIRFPETEISLGLDVTVKSRRLRGRLLIELLYDQETSHIALDMGIVALKALHQAHSSPTPPFTFGRAYDSLRVVSIIFGEIFPSLGLDSSQRRELWRLVRQYAWVADGTQVLLHGDLHPSNLIVDLEDNSLGFLDLEAMRKGKAATDFAPLWGACHFADPALGQRFYREYAEHFPTVLDRSFLRDAKAELALRSCLHIREAKRARNVRLEKKARRLLEIILSGASFDEICFRETSIGDEATTHP